MKPSKPFVLVVEDHALYRLALEGLLSASFPKALVASAESLTESLAWLSRQDPAVFDRSVVLLGLTMPGMSWHELIDSLQTRYPGLQAMVIAGAGEASRVGACLGQGVSAFISKAAAPERIVELIGRALAGKLIEPVWLGDKLPQELGAATDLRLTSRQMTVLGLICRGLSNRQIADELGIIEATAKAHVSAIFKELGVVNRAQALLTGQRLDFQSLSS